MLTFIVTTTYIKLCLLVSLLVRVKTSSTNIDNSVKPFKSIVSPKITNAYFTDNILEQHRILYYEQY